MVPLRHVVLFCAAAAFFTGCAWSQPPAEQQALVASYDIATGAEKPSLGKLMLTEQGLWAFVHAGSTSAAPTFGPGELVAFLPHEAGGPAHLFGVVVERSWGVMLQRLDGRSVEFDKVRGDLVPIRTESQLERWGLCRGAGGNLADDECLGSTKPNVAWRVYGADAQNRLVVSEQRSGLVLPIRTGGVVHAGRAVLRADVTAKGWIAVPMRAEQTVVPHARVLVDSQCSDIDLSQSLQRLEVRRGEVSAVDHPVDLEAAAIEAGVDAMVDCSGQQVVVQTPMLYRPRLRVAGSSASGVPYGAMLPWVFDAADMKTIESAVLLAASLGTGASLAADFYLERTLLAAGDTEIGQRLALELMQVPAAAGRPEAALLAGRTATSAAWHRQNSASFVLGKAWVLAALGQPRAYAESMARVSKLAEDAQNRRARLWLAWSQLRNDAGTAAKQSVARVLSVLEAADAPEWLEAGELLVGWVDRQQNDVSEPKTSLHEVFEPAAEGCKDVSSCKLDVYGRNFPALIEASDGESFAALIEQLRSTAVAAVAPGFRLSTLDTAKFSPADAVTIRAAAMPLLAPGLREEGFRALILEVANAWRESGTCLELSDAGAVVSRLDDVRGDQAGQPAIAATRWLLSDALTAACKSPRAFAKSLEAGLGNYPEITAHAAPLLEALASRAGKEDRLVMLRQFADFTADHEKGAACKRWNLALAVSSASAGRLDEAEAELSRAINCQAEGAGGYEASEQLVIGFLQFERSASVPQDLEASVRQRLEALVRRDPVIDGAEGICAGLLPLEYDLSRFVHPDIAALAVAMPESPPDDLALETSSRSTGRGIASLVVARRNLGEGRPRLAAKALVEARRAFERIEHTIGLRRVAFLESVVFGGDLESFLKRDETTPRQATSKKVRLGKLAQIDAADWASALMAGKAREILAATAVDGAELDVEAKRAALAASLIVDSEEQTLAHWRSSGGEPLFGELCGRDE